MKTTDKTENTKPLKAIDSVIDSVNCPFAWVFVKDEVKRANEERHYCYFMDADRKTNYFQQPCLKADWLKCPLNPCSELLKRIDEKNKQTGKG